MSNLIELPVSASQLFPPKLRTDEDSAAVTDPAPAGTAAEDETLHRSIKVED